MSSIELSTNKGNLSKIFIILLQIHESWSAAILVHCCLIITAATCHKDVSVFLSWCIVLYFCTYGPPHFYYCQWQQGPEEARKNLGSFWDKSVPDFPCHSCVIISLSGTCNGCSDHLLVTARGYWGSVLTSRCLQPLGKGMKPFRKSSASSPAQELLGERSTAPGSEGKAALLGTEEGFLGKWGAVTSISNCSGSGPCMGLCSAPLAWGVCGSRAAQHTAWDTPFCCRQAGGRAFRIWV